MSRLARRRLLLGFLLLTVAALVLDLTGSALPDRARAAAATAIGPVQRSLAAADRADGALEEENTMLRARLALAEARATEDEQARALLASAPATALLPARVVGTSTTVSGGRQVTLDVGARDGVEPNSAVVSADGLVGRVVTVAPWTSDVRVLDGADATVGVRVGSGALGSVSSAPVGDGASRAPGELTLTLVDRSAVAVGDAVTTLGSPGGRPYAPGLVVGTVTAVDPGAGRLATTAAVRPAVDPSVLHVVAVLGAVVGGAAPGAGTGSVAPAAAAAPTP